MKGNFTEVKPLRYWIQHILPLVYDDSLSYIELLGKVINTLNEVVKNNNMLPDYIMELIKEYISSGEIEKVLAEILANYMLNVKFPPAELKPATGDGSADDTEAIQGCIDYAYNNGGMSVYFPSGSYLTQPLTLRDKATLFGQDRYTTRLIMKGGATKAMFTGDVDELTLTGLGFDGNMDIQVNNVNLFTISVNSAIITNCLLTDGYDLLNITVNDDLQLNGVIFKHAVENALVLKGAGIVQGNNLVFKSVSALVGKNFVVMDVSKSILEQLKCYGASPNAVLINGSNNVVKMWNEQSLKAYTDNGANNTVEVYTQSEQKKLTGFKTTDVSGDLNESVGGNKTETITGNKDVNVHDINETVAGNYTKTVTGSISESANSFKTVIQLAYELTANRLTEQLTNKEVNATNSTENLGNKTETIIGEKEVTANTSTENIANKKHVIAGTVTEDIAGDKHVNAANSVETAVNKTVHLTKDSTEQVDGTRTLTVTGANNETTGARTETVNGNKTEHVTGKKEVNTNSIIETVTENKEVKANGLTENIANEKHVIAGSVIEDVTGDKHVNAANEIHSANIFDVENTLKYKNPIPVNDFYSNVPVMDRNGNIYNLMTATDKTENISRYLGNYPGVVTIGDSYGRGEGSGTIHKYTPWTTLIKNYLGLTENVNYWTNSLGGAGFKVALQGKNFNQLLNDLSETMSEQNRNTVGKILVAGGYNDNSNIYPEDLTDFFNTAKLKFPNAIVYVACIGWGTNRTIASSIANNTVPAYSKGAGLNGGVYITNSDFSLHNYAWFDEDGIHPNDDGQKNIAEMLCSGLLTGSCSNNYGIKRITVTPNPEICETCDIKGYCTISNDITGLFFDFGKTVRIGKKVSTNTPLLLGTLNCDFINAIENSAFASIPVIGYAAYTSSGIAKYFNPIGNMWISGKKLYLNIINIGDDESGFKDLGTLGVITFRLLNTVIPTHFC